MIDNVIATAADDEVAPPHRLMIAAPETRSPRPKHRGRRAGFGRAERRVGADPAPSVDA